MATAAKRKTTPRTTAAMKNPSGTGQYRIAGGTKTATAARKNTSSAIAKRGTSAAAKANPPKKRKNYRRNPSPAMSSVLFAVAGAIALKTFDLGIGQLSSRLGLNLVGTMGIGAKVGVGFLVGSYGRKYLGSWADIASKALYLSAALSAWDQWVAPRLPAALGGTAPAATVVATQPVQNQETGQLGTRYIMGDGTYADAFGSQPGYVN